MPFTSNKRPEQVARVLADDHSEIDALIRDLLSALEEEDKSKVFARLDLLWARLAVHIRAEHLCLFPSILAANFSTRSGGPQYQEAQIAVVQFRLDHEFFMRELGAAVNMIRKQETPSEHEAISKQLEEVRRSIVKIQTRLDQHNQLEENQIYKWVDVLLGEPERVALTARIRHELENIPPRFQPA
ncbi:MAG TPA: hypothetical protein VGJ48_19685 [Pyrinomonadaceae bacterium]|jgi:hemerythrin superfamily protein